MTEPAKGIEGLSGRHLMSILTFLCRRGPCKKSELYGAVSSNPRMPQKLDELETLGLILQDQDPVTRATFVSLTDRGADIAARLLEVDEFLRSSRARVP